ncbi:expressed unknown protein [Seminavis robusta]|uniref:Reverse transcriptase domain-containing protein n=1 Tax=Seminavis robusta TaxID=568900 RepID=A0A9N8DRJ6_9STRA|nr:expressed unknown protein [Seminavis robusta]|eukprot:Sro301_g111841.1  (205) ;mRNA; r:13760-14374
MEKQSRYAHVISFGYQYQRLPTGCCQSTDYAQRSMEDVLHDIEEVEVGCLAESWQQHIKHLDCILPCLQANNFTINPLKCEWAVQETDFLGLWLTPTGIKPWKKKIDTILELERPTNLRELRSFVGAVNFYKDTYPQQSHMLDPLHRLTSITNSKKFEWLPEHTKAFEQMKAKLARFHMRQMHEAIWEPEIKPPLAPKRGAPSR